MSRIKGHELTGMRCLRSSSRAPTATPAMSRAILARDYSPPRYRRILQRILHIRRCTAWPGRGLGKRALVGERASETAVVPLVTPGFPIDPIRLVTLSASSSATVQGRVHRGSSMVTTLDCLGVEACPAFAKFSRDPWKSVLALKLVTDDQRVPLPSTARVPPPLPAMRTLAMRSPLSLACHRRSTLHNLEEEPSGTTNGRRADIQRSASLDRRRDSRRWSGSAEATPPASVTAARTCPPAQSGRLFVQVSVACRWAS